VRVVLTEAADEFRIAVADEGVGIPADDLPHIFERFHRGGNVTGRVGGLGLGLTSALRAVRAHGGRIGVESVEGQGTTFTITVPRSA
jgi:signal transduction histidine kinase